MSPAPPGAGDEEVPLSMRRRAIARAMMRSLRESAQLTCAVRADVGRVVQAQRRYKEAFRDRHGRSLSPFPFVARAVALSLLEDPVMNSTIDEERGVVLRHAGVHLGVAVDDAAGLVVGKIPDAQQLATAELAAAIAGVADRIRAGTAKIDDVTGTTFTLTNTGSRGSVFDTPILNYPEVGILAVTAFERQLVPRGDDDDFEVALQWSTLLCLTYDHRLVDGADAARFLNRVAQRLREHDFDAELAASLGATPESAHSARS